MDNKKNSLLKNICYALAVAILVLGIPFLINEMYKIESAYVTLWNAADALSYYGTLLGAAATVWVLGRTIKFSLNQIRYEKHFNKHTEKWKHIETLFDKAIICAQPLTLNDIYTLGLSSKSLVCCAELKKQTSAMDASLDIIVGSLDDEDLTKVENLINALKSVIDKNKKCANRYFDLFILFNMSSNNNGESLDVKTIAVLQEQKEICEEIEKIHSNDYIHLMNIKKECFKDIYKYIEKDSKKILTNGI